jgi:hypothetical protein
MFFPLGLASGAEQQNGIANGNTYQSRDNPVHNFVDNVHWQKGDHSFSFGGNLIRTTMHQETLGSAGIPTFRYGLVASDPATALFNSTTLPAIGATSLTDAQNLYALLTGRIATVTSVVNIDSKTHQFVPFNPVQLREAMTSFGMYFADSWRLGRSLTLNYGLRWDFRATTKTQQYLYEPDGARPVHLRAPSRKYAQPVPPWLAQRDRQSRDPAAVEGLQSRLCQSGAAHRRGGTQVQRRHPRKAGGDRRQDRGGYHRVTTPKG